MEPWADYISVRPAQAPRKLKFALDAGVKPKALVTTGLSEGLLAIIQPVGDVMREADENKRAPSLDAVLKTIAQPKILKGIHDGIIYALTAGSLINLLEGMCHPLSLPATAAGRYLLHDLSVEGRIAASDAGLVHSVALARPFAALRMGVVSGHASVIPAASHVLVGTLSRFVVAANALLARGDEIALEKALVQYNAEVIQQRAEAVAAAASQEPEGAGAPESKAEKPQLPKPVDVAAMMAEYSQFDSASRAGAASAKAHAAKAGQQSILVDGKAAPAARVSPEGLTVHEYVNTLDSITVQALGQVMWHYVALPSAQIIQKQTIFACKQAGGALVGTLLVPGKGTTVCRLIAELL